MKKQERGTALFIALVALAILTVVGLSLAMVTETEMITGGAEKTSSEQFFATEGGMATQVASLAVTADTGPVNVVIPSQSVLAGSDGNARQTGNRVVLGRMLGYDVLSSGLAPVAVAVLPFSKANEGRGDKYYSYYYRTTILTRRTNWDSANPVPTCTDLETVDGQTIVTSSFYYAPAQELPDIGLVDATRNDVAGSYAYCGPSSTESVYAFVQKKNSWN